MHSAMLQIPTVSFKGRKVWADKGNGHQLPQRGRKSRGHFFPFFILDLFLLEITLVYNIIEISCVQHYIFTPVYPTAWSPSKAEFLFVTTEWSFYPFHPPPASSPEETSTLFSVFMFVFVWFNLTIFMYKGWYTSVEMIYPFIFPLLIISLCY